MTAGAGLDGVVVQGTRHCISADRDTMLMPLPSTLSISCFGPHGPLVGDPTTLRPSSGLGARPGTVVQADRLIGAVKGKGWRGWRWGVMS